MTGGDRDRKMQDFSKVFAIGFNKSGTVSLHSLFQELGLHSYHGTEWRDCSNLKLLNSYDCFTDGVPKDIGRLDGLFPKAKFVLQVRELDQWIYSRMGHIDRAKGKGVHEARRTWENTEDAIESWIRRRNAHHTNVLSYFDKRESDLLVVNFCREVDAGTRVARFLGYSGTYYTPRKNSKSDSTPPKEYAEMLARVADKLGIPAEELSCDFLCPSLMEQKNESNDPKDTSSMTRFRHHVSATCTDHPLNQNPPFRSTSHTS